MFDVNGDGAISKEEFVHHVCQECPLTIRPVEATVSFCCWDLLLYHWNDSFLQLALIILTLGIVYCYIPRFVNRTYRTLSISACRVAQITHKSYSS